MNASLTYVYCLVRGTRRPVLREAPPGLPGAGPIRPLDAGNGLWAIVSSVPAADYDERAIAAGLPDLDWVGARAVAHESVVEHFLASPGVLPMQLFTLFVSDARALEHVAGDRRRIEGIFGRIAGQLEWGLRLTFDEKSARDAVHAGQRKTADDSGAGYLARKRDLLDVSRGRLEAAQSEADRLYRSLSREATDARRRTVTEQGIPGSRLLLDAAFLVPARRTGAFRTALRANARKLQSAGLVVTLTGPWPPYNFIAPPRRAPRRPPAKPARTRPAGTAAAGTANGATGRDARTPGARAPGSASASHAPKRAPRRAAAKRR